MKPANVRRVVKAATQPKAGKPAAATTRRQTAPGKRTDTKRTAAIPEVLAGGNPRMAKAEGAAPVREYIEGMPGWKRALGRRLDELIVGCVPGVRKAVKWNSPFYGVEGQGYFLAFHVFTNYVKVTFFFGAALNPVVPGGTGKDARWINLHEETDLDKTPIASWIKQAAARPGWLA